MNDETAIEGQVACKMDEQMIELVREHEELYDMSHRKYMDTPHKNKLWDEIGQTLKTGKHINKFLNLLLNSYVQYYTLYVIFYHFAMPPNPLQS